MEIVNKTFVATQIFIKMVVSIVKTTVAREIVIKMVVSTVITTVTKETVDKQTKFICGHGNLYKPYLIRVIFLRFSLKKLKKLRNSIRCTNINIIILK